MKTIEVIVSPKGETTITTNGFAGGECKEASRFLEHALGQRTAEKLTSEFHQTEHARQSQHQRQ